MSQALATPTRKVVTGNHAVSYGALLSRVQVISAYPITPQTQVVELLSNFCDDGSLDAEFIKVESEHSAMAALVGAASSGVRTFTATSAHGLALMHEMLHWSAGARLPIVMANINRAMGAPWSVWTDQNDSLAQRDTGWMQIYCESNQEVLDTVLQAYKIAERISLPAMVVLDAFVLSHTAAPVEIPSQQQADDFLPPFHSDFIINTEDPHAYSGLATPDTYMELRYKIQETMSRAVQEWEAVDQDFGDQFGRQYGIVDPYFVEDSEILLVTSSTITSTARDVIDTLRSKGWKVGLLKIRLFRPFPAEHVRRYLSGAKKIAVIDRNIGFGVGGIFAQELKAALFGHLNIPVFCYITGLGGRGVTPATIQTILDHVSSHEIPGESQWIGVKDE